MLVGLDGFHVVGVVRFDDGLVATVETVAGRVFCSSCGVAAVSRGRREHRLVDIPAFGPPVLLVWRKRVSWCLQHGFPARAFTEQDDSLVPPRGLLTIRACWWAIGQLRVENASVAPIARQFGTSWKAVWRSIRPLLKQLGVETRFVGVTDLGVDEHVGITPIPVGRVRNS